MRKTLAAIAVGVLLASCAGSADGDPVAESLATSSPSSVATDPVTVPTIEETVDAQTAQPAAETAGEPVGVGSASPTRSITISGVGAEYAPPVRSVVNLGVSVRRPSVAEASQAASVTGATVVAAVEAAGVTPADIQTSEFWIGPVYDRYDYEVITGYEVHLGYNVAFSDIDDVGSVLGAAIAAGGDDVRANGIRFEPDSSTFMGAARSKAWEDVRARAAETAELAGEPLGQVLDVHEKVLITTPQGMVQGGEGDSAHFDIPVSPGAAGVTVLLTVTYAIGE